MDVGTIYPLKMGEQLNADVSAQTSSLGKLSNCVDICVPKSTIL